MCKRGVVVKATQDEEFAVFTELAVKATPKCKRQRHAKRVYNLFFCFLGLPEEGRSVFPRSVLPGFRVFA